MTNRELKLFKSGIVERQIDRDLESPSPIDSNTPIYNIMLDLETLGGDNNAIILAIGAVKFDLNNGLSSTFYKTINIQSCVNVGMSLTGDNLLWWLKQSKKAIDEAFKGEFDIKDVLVDFYNWLGTNTSIKIWGYSSTFDNTILSTAYKQCGMKAPWFFWNDRCYGTVVNSFDKIEISGLGTRHNALDDAKRQAIHLIKIVKANNLTKLL